MSSSLNIFNCESSLFQPFFSVQVERVGAAYVCAIYGLRLNISVGVLVEFFQNPEHTRESWVRFPDRDFRYLAASFLYYQLSVLITCLGNAHKNPKFTVPGGLTIFRLGRI